MYVYMLHAYMYIYICVHVQLLTHICSYILYLHLYVYTCILALPCICAHTHFSLVLLLPLGQDLMEACPLHRGVRSQAPPSSPRLPFTQSPISTLTRASGQSGFVLHPSHPFESGVTHEDKERSSMSTSSMRV